MKKSSKIILIIISIVLICIFAFLLINQNNNKSTDVEIIEFEGSKITVFLDDKETEAEGFINDNNELSVNMKLINQEDKTLTLKELQDLGYNPIVNNYLNNTLIYLYTPDENLTQEDIDKVKNTLDLSLTGVGYKDANKLGNLVNGPKHEKNTHYFPLAYSPYGTVMVYDGLVYDDKKLPKDNMEKFAKEYSAITAEDIIWDDNETGFEIELNTVEATHVSRSEKEGYYYLTAPYLRYDFQHITDTINGETYNGYYANNLLEDAHAKTLLAAMNYFGNKAFAERVFSLVDNYYFFSKENDKPMTKEYVEKYDLTFIKDVPSSNFDGKNEYYRELHVSYNDEIWVLYYDLGTRIKTNAPLTVKIPMK